jgi:hypothetical protein
MVSDMNEIQYSRARTELADLHEDALSHLPTRITRRRASSAVLLSESDFLGLLSPFEFHPEVLFEEGATSIWLPELAIWGRGDSFATAKEDLLEEVAQLLAVLEEDDRLRNAPNIVSQLPWVYRLMAVPEGEWENTLFAEPTQREQPARALVAATA